MSFKTTVLFLLSSILTSTGSLAQNKARAVNNTKSKSSAVSVGINIPVGTFSQTHVAGIALGYSWSHYRFSRMKKELKTLIGFTGNGGFGYYFGRKAVIAGNDYRYSEYISVHAFGGGLLSSRRKGYLTLTTGVIAGIYKGTADPGFGANLGAVYPLTEKINLAGSIICLKRRHASGLYAANLRVEYSF